MKILILSSHDPADVAHGIGIIVYNTVRCLTRLSSQIEMAVITDEGHRDQGFSYAQGGRDFMDRITIIRHQRKTDPKTDALRALTGHLLNRAERQFSADVRRLSQHCDLAVWFGHLMDPLTREVASTCECPVLLHVSDSIALSRRQRSTGASASIIAELARFQESSVISCLKAGRVGIVYVAEGDRECGLSMARPANAGTVFCLPLAVDTEVFSPATGPRMHAEVPVVLFTGTMNFRPNVVAADRLVRQVLPLLRQSAEVRLVGKNPNAQISDLAAIDSRVHVTGKVHDIAAEYRAADIFLAPMPPSSGMKNKLLEAMACGLPVVATPEACGGFDGIPPGVLTGSSDEALAALVTKLLEDPEFRHETGEAGRQYVVEHHSWIDRTRRLVKLLSAQPEGSE